MLNQSGIYQIRNTVNGKVYVGSAVLLKRRWSCHRHELRKGGHHSKHLQLAWRKHGKENFVFEPLITCAKSMLLWYEQQFMDQMKPEYNMSPTAGNCLGVPCSPEKRAKLSEAHKGKVLAPEHRAKVAAVLAIARNTPEFRARSRAQAFMMGKLPQTREAARKRMTGRNVLPETRAKLSAARKGKPMHVNLSEDLTERRLAAIREYNHTRPITPELLRNMSEGQKKRAGIEEFEYNGESKSVLAWAEQYNLDRHVLRKRLNAAWAMERALFTVVNKKPRKS